MWAYIEDNQVKQVYQTLPKSFNTKTGLVLNFHKLDLQKLNEFGFYRVYKPPLVNFEYYGPITYNENEQRWEYQKFSKTYTDIIDVDDTVIKTALEQAKEDKLHQVYKEKEKFLRTVSNLKLYNDLKGSKIKNNLDKEIKDCITLLDSLETSITEANTLSGVLNISIPKETIQDYITFFKKNK